MKFIYKYNEKTHSHSRCFLLFQPTIPWLFDSVTPNDKQADRPQLPSSLSCKTQNIGTELMINYGYSIAVLHQ
jgi:hypothetical protein